MAGRVAVSTFEMCLVMRCIQNDPHLSLYAPDLFLFPRMISAFVFSKILLVERALRKMRFSDHKVGCFPPPSRRVGRVLVDLKIRDTYPLMFLILLAVQSLARYVCMYYDIKLERKRIKTRLEWQDYMVRILDR